MARRSALAEVLYEHVGALGEALHDRHARGLLQIDRQAPLVAVVGLEVEVRPVAKVEALRLQHAAPRIAADALLDLDHVGAEVAEHDRGDRPLLPDGPVDDADPVERHGHRNDLRAGSSHTAGATGKPAQAARRTRRWK